MKVIKHQPKAIIEWLRETDIQLSKISKKTGIARKTLHNWKEGFVPSPRLLTKLVDYYENLSLARSIKVDSNGIVDKDYVIQLQKEKIKMLEEKQDLFNQKQKSTSAIEADQQAGEDTWNVLECDMTTIVQLSWQKTKLARTILTVGEDLSRMEELLGYTEKELREDIFCENETFVFSNNNHPIDLIIDNSSKEKLREYVINFPSIFETMKAIIGKHYIPFDISYIAKNGKIFKAVCYNRVEWRKMTVHSKVRFLG